MIADPAGYAALRDGLRAAGLATRAHAGGEALEALVAGDACDTVVAAIVGAAGLPSTLAAARAGKRLLLANKESLVLAGELLMRRARRRTAPTIVPIDSEHNAIFQCLPRDGELRAAACTASPDRLGRPVPRPHAARSSPRSPRRRRWRIRSGRWGRRSRSIRPP